MARITVEDVYRGEKYDVLSAAGAEFLTKGRPAGYSRQTWLELLLVKHTLIAANKITREGDWIGGMISDESPFPIKRWYEDDDDD